MAAANVWNNYEMSIVAQMSTPLAALRRLLDLIQEGEIEASPTQVAFLRGVELGLRHDSDRGDTALDKGHQ